MLLGTGLGVLLHGRDLGGRLVFALAALLSLGVCLVAARLLTRPLASLLRALTGSVAAFKDGDFSFSLATRRRDEIGDLVAAHNALGRVLREERQALFQRELLLDTLAQNAPTALVLVNARDTIVYANSAARRLLHAGRRLEGHHLAALLEAAPAPLRDAVAERREGLFGVELGAEEEIFHLATRGFRLNGQAHRLFLIRHMTREISRQEVASWKKVLRVISHELNNSLAPISSLAHSGRELARRGEVARLDGVLATIGERAGHLAEFIRGYAAFAKLPAPRPEAIHWQPFLAKLALQYPFAVAQPLPEAPGWADPAQLGQALINLLKNAHESGSDPAAISVRVGTGPGECRIEVADAGPGMSEKVLASALVPFYSTKRSGTGLGLALAREIAEAHGGRIALSNRPGGGLLVRLSLPAAPGG
ncbi:MAG: HAMP domain-containing protein [Xanthomonadales bacterium]|nr:HAMP domain-containing protein [Xanthomonadales bacterium]